MSPENEGGPPERPDYKVYRSRRGFRKPDLAGLRAKTAKTPKPAGDPAAPKAPGAGPQRSTAVRILKWVGVAALVWILISFVAFAVSAQIQKSKLSDDAKDALEGGNPLMAAFPQTILVLGTDIRSGAFAGPEEAESKACIEDVIGGEPTGTGCKNAPFRSDTIMLIRAGGGAFRQLSIPRDTLAEVPGLGPQKINSAYASGGAELAIQTVEGLLGIDINQLAVIDFDGFRRFIDALGGIEVELEQAVCSSISGGAFGLDLEKGTHTLNGFQAITLARTRSSADCNGDGAIDDPSLNDVDRAGFQKLIVDGIKGRMTDPLRLPYNLIKGPIIGWSAPKAMVSSMGALAMPQLVFAAAIGGGESAVLEPAATTAAGNLVVSPEECEKAARRLLGEDPPREPNCPQG
ncbi:MAG: LCP family protein [Solirubrobacterales bacterium]